MSHQQEVLSINSIGISQDVVYPLKISSCCWLSSSRLHHTIWHLGLPTINLPKDFWSVFGVNDECMHISSKMNKLVTHPEETREIWCLIYLYLVISQFCGSAYSVHSSNRSANSKGFSPQETKRTYCWLFWTGNFQFWTNPPKSPRWDPPFLHNRTPEN